jgi:hypothetical protein
MKALALLIIGAVTLIACSPASVSENAPPTTLPGAPVTLVVLGSDEAFGAGLPRDARQRSSWAQLLFHDHLPARATLVDLASQGATAADVLRQQIPNTLSLHPTIAVLWITGDRRSGTPADAYQRALTSCLTALRDAAVEHVVVVAGPGGSDDYAVATRTAATDTGAALVDATMLASPLDISGHAKTAELITAALGPIS